MTQVRISGADTFITDDVEAIRRARRAECHELRVLHHIRMNGRAVLSTLNGVPNPNDQLLGRRLSSRYQQSSQPGGDRQDTTTLYGSASEFQGVTVDSSRSTYSGVSRPQSEKWNSATHGSSVTLVETDCKGIWCLIRDMLLAYAVIGLTYLLLSKSSPGTGLTFRSTEEAYDFTP